MNGLTGSVPQGLPHPLHALILGGKGGIGAAVAETLLQAESTVAVTVTSRDRQWCHESTGDQRLQRMLVDLEAPQTIGALAEHLKGQATPPNFIFNCTGLLHDESVQPERALKHLSLPQMKAVFGVNTFGVALLLKELLPLFHRKEPAIFASISARVASISDNRLGGWYSYRASKAAQNMIIRTAAIEAKRTHPQVVCVALHPGTVRTPLSDPFTQRKKPHEVFSPQQAAGYLLNVLGDLSPADSGLHFAWDGEVIPW